LIQGLLGDQGLQLRGGFHPELEDQVPDLETGPCKTLLLVGNFGRELWPHFSCAPETLDGLPDPLDRWTVRIISSIAIQLGAEVRFPFKGPPFLPFQRWALKAEGLHPSPLGLLVHPRWGLWHAWRAALLFSEQLPLSPKRAQPSPCEGCSAPCLKACPVGAFDGRSYAVECCQDWLRDKRDAVCMQRGCLARHACPQGQPYSPSQAQHHMQAFLHL